MEKINEGNYNFRADLLTGESGEKVIRKDLESMGAIFISDNKTNTHDILMGFKGKEITYECKTDTYLNSPNLFVETHCRGKESGLNVTQAEWFVTYFKNLNEIWYIKSEDLRNLIANNYFYKVGNAGDANSNTCGYLINRANFREHFIVRDPIKHKKIV